MKTETTEPTTTPATLPTVIHAYSFYIDEPAGKAAYEALRAKLADMGLECFESHGGGSHHHDWVDAKGSPVELETAHLFNNQWNTAPIPGVSDNGLRVFDWAQDYMPNRNPYLKRGHWLEQTPAMKAARHDNVKCGYCGHMQPYDPAQTLCHACAGSSFLTEKDYPLLRLRRIDASEPRKYPPLTEAGTAELVAVIEPARAEAKKARLAKTRADLIESTDKEIADARTELAAKLWLLDHGQEIGNVIYYNHTGRFCFGWQNPLTPAEHSALCDLLCEFPYDYDLKTVNNPN